MAEQFDFPTPPRPPNAGEGTHWDAQSEPASEAIRARYASVLFQRVPSAIIDYLPPLILALYLGNFGTVLGFAWIIYNSMWRAGVTGQSWGKTIMNIRLIHVMTDYGTGENYFCYPGLRTVPRYFFHVLDLFFGIGLFYMLLSSERKCIADACVRTICIRDDPRIKLFSADEARELRRGGF